MYTADAQCSVYVPVGISCSLVVTDRWLRSDWPVVGNDNLCPGARRVIAALLRFLEKLYLSRKLNANATDCLHQAVYELPTPVLAIFAQSAQ